MSIVSFLRSLKKKKSMQVKCLTRLPLQLHSVCTHKHTLGSSCRSVSWGLLAVLHSSGYAQSIQARGLGTGPGSSPRFWVINAASAQGLQGLLKTGLSLIGHTSLTPSRLLARQLIRQAEQKRAPTRHRTQNSFLDFFFFLKHHFCFTSSSRLWKLL